MQRETTRVRIPLTRANTELPRSAALLERLYAGDLCPREKKPFVIDTRRSCGPFMVSVDEDPLVLLDACSQIATLSHGFANPHLLRAIDTGVFQGCLWSNPDVTVESSPELSAYRAALLRMAPSGLDHVCFVTAGGGEANEKALRIARLVVARPECKRVLALRGGFHGRTFAVVMATWNRDKRAPFELQGYEAVFAEPEIESVARLLDAHAAEIYAVIVEPMMSEGGDVYLARDFFQGVRKLTRERGIPLVVDEVQTGFCTGGPFFWWQRLGFPGPGEGDSSLSPDLLTCAKKAGLGVVLSRWPDPEPSPIHVASALRGLVQLEHAYEQADIEELCRPHLDALAERFPMLEYPRLSGTTFAFELPDAAMLERFVAQRFQRGFMTYPAGERTIRFRLNASWSARNVEDLFARISAALERLDDPSATMWQAEAVERRAGDGNVVLRRLEESDWPDVVAMEHSVYEPARWTKESQLRAAAAHGLALVARAGEYGELLGFCFAGRLEYFTDLDGPRHDDHRGRGDTAYSLDCCVSSGARGRGLGRLLKLAQLQWAREQGFSYVTGRNRVGSTDAMMALNRSLGAYPVVRLEHQYGGEAQADYYRIALTPPAPPPVLLGRRPFELASGIQQPFGPQPAFMAERELVGPTCNKLNLSNWATLDSVHYAEHLRLVLPRGTKHVYFTSSRDEALDKCLRCLRLSRQSAELVLGLSGGYLGHVTASARSLSDSEGFGPLFGLFDWPRLPHPQEHGTAAMLAAFDDIVSTLGQHAVLAVVVEIVGERSGLVLHGKHASALSRACRDHDIPFIIAETTTGCYRSGAGTWGIDCLPSDVVPDAVVWYPGGQLGHVFVSDRYFIAKPLALISTWDGDELSLVRAHEHLRAARKLDLTRAITALNELVIALAARLPGARIGGLGLYRSLELVSPEQAQSLHRAAAIRGIRLGRGRPATLVFVPALDVDADELAGSVLASLLEAVEDIHP